MITSLLSCQIIRRSALYFQGLSFKTFTSKATMDGVTAGKMAAAYLAVDEHVKVRTINRKFEL